MCRSPRRRLKVGDGSENLASGVLNLTPASALCQVCPHGTLRQGQSQRDLRQAQRVEHPARVHIESALWSGHSKCHRTYRFTPAQLGALADPYFCARGGAVSHAEPRRHILPHLQGLLPEVQHK